MILSLMMYPSIREDKHNTAGVKSLQKSYITRNVLCLLPLSISNHGKHCNVTDNDKNVAYYEQVATASPLDNFFVFVLLYAQCRVNMIDMMKNMSHNFLVYFKGKTIYLP